mmetsp:Transcript_55699/g.121700  ORF Transcript_55699/g.121700 Transcript_55699/m.121700 type:complete len:1706 (+) Transcript_55699:265-5382(+)
MENSYAQGTLIWIKDPEEVWVQAEIVSSNDKEIIVKRGDSENADQVIVLSPNEPIFLRTSDVYTSEGLSVLDDLTQLAHLHEPAVLSSLQNRFDIDKIYTFTGPILIALNPFKYIPGLYDEEILKTFISTKPSTKPHVFNTSNASYRGICDRQKSQTVLISGESGAGKTETTKHVMKFLALAGSEDGAVTNVEKQVLESNPLLEAFGNARTLRNDNSSRFGKFIELQFRGGSRAAVQTGQPGENSRLCGARIRTYLLEKVRVADQQEGERNYHVFYEACAAAATLSGTSTYSYPKKLPADKVKEPRDIDLEGFSELKNFAYLTKSTCETLKDVDDVEMFERRINAMQTIGIKADHIQSIFRVIAAVLHLGNVRFDAPPNNSEGSQVMSECSASIELAAKLTGVERPALEAAMCHQTRVMRTEKVRSPVNVRTASDNRDALAKALYGMIFDYIVKNTNQSIGFVPDVKLFVGVLDIFGFECFKMNSFEQLCINFTNERLQQFFNSFVFKLEEQLYEREGIPWDPLDFPDNQDAVDIMQAKQSGIFSMLDEECFVPQGSDQGFCNKLIKQHKGHRRFDEIRTKPSWFIVKHFAGPVQYCTEGFLDKNKDMLSNDLIECMGIASKNDFVKEMFQSEKKYSEVLHKDEQPDKPAGGSRKKKITVSSEFKDQLSSLMDIVDLTEPHFIRCIKPNPQNVQDLYDRKGVTEQLRYGGVLQIVQVSRAGYPVRINHQECWDDYRILGNPSTIAGLKHVDDAKIRAKKLLDHLDVELNLPKPNHGLSFAVGKTMVFFKLPAFERLKFLRLEMMSKAATKIQASYRRKMRMRMYQGIRSCARHVQAMLRVKQARLDLLKRKQLLAAVKVQSCIRMFLAKRRYKKILVKVARIQARIKGISTRKWFKEHRRHTAATKIQRNWRRFQDQKVYKLVKKTIILAQERMRLVAAKTQMQKLKKEAKEVGALMAKSQKAVEQANEIRKKNDELEAVQLQLQSEKGNLQKKIKNLEDIVGDLQGELEEAKKQAEEAIKMAADHSKTIIETEKLEAMAKQMEEKDVEVAELRKELEAAKEASAALEQQLKEGENRYKKLLASVAAQSTAGMNVSVLPGAAKPVVKTAGASKSNRSVYVQIVGTSGTGKTTLLEHLVKDQDPAIMEAFNNQKTNLMSHHSIKIDGQSLKFLDCREIKTSDATSKVRAQNLVKEWFYRSQWVCVVYDMADNDSFEYALQLVKDIREAKARVVLFGNRFHVDKGSPIAVDVAKAKDIAIRNNGIAVESTSLLDAVKMAMNAADEESSMGPSASSAEGMSPQDTRRGSLLDSVKSWFTNPADKGSKANQGVLRPSLKGTKSMKSQRASQDINADLRPVQELQDSESAVTCICFGQERSHKNYILLATASKDGTVVVYRCYRTEMEIAMIADQKFTEETDEGLNARPSEHSNIAVHSRLTGHTRAITSIFFNLLEDQLVTTSIDKSVRFWFIETGEMLKVFTDSSPVPVATFLPFNPQVFVAANSNAVLRLVNVQNGMVMQKLKVETEVRALRFDDTGLFLLAGTKSGSIHVLEASDNTTLKFKFKVHLARGGVTCITFVPANYDMPPCLLVNTSDSNATIIDCTYGPPPGVLTNLAVRTRVRVAHSLLPLKCCYSPSGHGYLISGSEDKEVYIYPLAKNNGKMQYLKHHQVPVVAVAVNMQDTMLASADSLGRIVLWRRIDFSHIPD